jgi:hypothetical protein
VITANSRRRAAVLGLAVASVLLVVGVSTAVITSDPLGLVGLLVVLPVMIVVLAIAWVAVPATKSLIVLRRGPRNPEET